MATNFSISVSKKTQEQLDKIKEFSPSDLFRRGVETFLFKQEHGYTYQNRIDKMSESIVKLNEILLKKDEEIIAFKRLAQKVRAGEFD